MKTMTHAISMGAAAALLALAGGAALADQLDSIKAAGSLKCGVGSQYKPFSFVQDPKTRKFVGYDVDICEAVATKIGVKPELVFITGATRVTDLQSGRTDIALANLTHTPERAQLVDFSDNYFASQVKVMVPASSSIKSFADLTGKRLAGISGSNHEVKVPKVITGADLKVFPSPANAYLALEQGKVESMVGDETTLIGLIGGQQDKWRILDQPVDTQQIGIGVRKGEARMVAAVNDTLSDLEKSGKATQIFDRWFGKDSELKMKRSFSFAPYMQP
ncbi:transporter substrate-binding domain-containing protein [Variovorax sp. J31P207]|uniref:transporter substrate-binding domain-containing protein n=1 Tax=Variovorax sp. J31P207 TaxID=3053510 RepID=UPI002574DEA3|nr:transporter substrate-binding domain-containing protein [Variovorax sp. J31P207]MDM0066189.1 transporter substrate-binding domain-containing protein [Variovorax sp. J31P207]